MKKFCVNGDFWLVRAPSELGAEFGFDVSQDETLVKFHETLSSYPRVWLIVRRLFGIGPVNAMDDSEGDRVWSKSEVMESVRIQRKQLEAELETARGFWHNASAPRDVSGGYSDKSGGTESVVSGVKASGQASFQFDGDLLSYYGFDDAMFQMKGRSPEENEKEKQWFAQCLRDWTNMFESPMAGQIARNALLNRLRMRRLETLEMQIGPTDAGYKALRREFSDLEKTYQDQLNQLDVLFPWKREVSGKMSGKATVSALVEAIREYRGNKNNELVDGIFAAAEIELELRTNTLQKTPQYRLGLVTYLNAVRSGLWDPHWQNRFSESTIAKLDRGFQKGVQEARDDIGEALVDLESASQEEEYSGIPDELLSHWNNFAKKD